MKSFLKSFLVAASAFLTMTACEKEEEKLILNQSAVPVVSASASNIVLTKDNAAKDALTLQWPSPDYGFNAASSYTLLIDKKGGDFTKAASIPVGNNTKKTFTHAELNALLIGMGLAPNTAAALDYRVTSNLGGRTVLSSVLGSLMATPYLDRLDLSTIWGVVGDATANGWNGPDQPFYKTDKPNELVAYVSLVDGFVKFRTNNDWALNLGGSAGKLTADNGPNIAVAKGTYKIMMNPVALTYSIESFSWGLVGDATANGWNGPDQQMTYDPTTDQWFAVVALKAGEAKIRRNNDWEFNFGGANGRLVEKGDNFKIAAAGTYLVVADFKTSTLKYSITLIKGAWGLVGDATPNGWNGPDQAFRPDLTKDGVWTLTGVRLIPGEIKIRADNKWDTNYGDDGANGSLEQNGANIKIAAAGTYDIMIDFTNAASPRITVTRK